MGKIIILFLFEHFNRQRMKFYSRLVVITGSSFTRPSSLHPNFRLDRLLQSCAESGVKIYIIVYKELSLALAIDSYHTKTALEGLHPNIRVQRHPDHLAGGVLYWARHEKFVVIDQSTAFIGGLGKEIM